MPWPCWRRWHKSKRGNDQTAKDMETLDVQEIRTMSEVATHNTHVVAFPDYLLTTLFGYSPALLHAEFQHSEPEVSWFIRPIRGTTQQDILCAVSDFSGGCFRAMLARFGHHYMGDQLYGGYALRLLRQRGREHRCHIYMSNNGQSGFWIRVYAAVV